MLLEPLERRAPGGLHARERGPREGGQKRGTKKRHPPKKTATLLEEGVSSWRMCFLFCVFFCFFCQTTKYPFCCQTTKKPFFSYKIVFFIEKRPPDIPTRGGPALEDQPRPLQASRGHIAAPLQASRGRTAAPLHAKQRPHSRTQISRPHRRVRISYKKYIFIQKYIFSYKNTFSYQA